MKTDETSSQSQKRSPLDDLFIETVFFLNNLLIFCLKIFQLLVEPSRFRPIRFLKGDRYEHPTTVNLRRLLEANQLLTLLKIHMQPGGIEAAGAQYSATAKVCAKLNKIDLRILGIN